ncbi:MAG: IS982 family transposase [Thermomicrobiales bacterium]
MVVETAGADAWTFEDLCLWVYCIVDELWGQIAPRCRRPGPAPVCSDPELVTMALVGEAKGWDQETELLSAWAAHRDLFPRQPSRTRFNRRRRALQGAINELRRLVLGLLDLAQDRRCAIDALPIPVIRFHLVAGANRADWQAYEARFGKVPSKQLTIFGSKLYLLVTLNGVILDFVLAPATVLELHAGIELLEEHTDLEAVGDKAFISAPLAERLWTENRVRVLTLPRRNQRQQVSPAVRRLVNGARQIVETVTGQLAEQFQIEVNHAQSFWGLTARMLTKLTAHTLCVYLNRLLGRPDALHIKTLAFPI